MFERLKIHHVGIVVEKRQINYFEKKYGNNFTVDDVQGTRVMFVDDKELLMYREFVVKEGRAENLQLGFSHFCYDVKSTQKLNQIEQWVKENKIGYPVTELEKSGSDECGFVRFFYIKNQGLIELNLVG